MAKEYKSFRFVDYQFWYLKDLLVSFLDDCLADEECRWVNDDFGGDLLTSLECLYVLGYKKLARHYRNALVNSIHVDGDEDKRIAKDFLKKMDFDSKESLKTSQKEG